MSINWKVNDKARQITLAGADTISTERNPIVSPLPQSLPGDIDAREERLFRSLDKNNSGSVSARDFLNALTAVGLREDDRRLKESMAAMDAAVAAAAEPGQEAQRIGRVAFCQAIRHNILLLERALQGRMVIPDFVSFQGEIDAIFNQVRDNRDGAPANYISQLDVVGEAADRFAVALCTIDGQRHSIGDAAQYFTVQSTSKPISYALALEEHGSEFVHHHVGHEPSGVGFNELTLNKNRKPHNPMINAGAIMSAAMIGLSDKQKHLQDRDKGGEALRGWPGRRFEAVLDRWRALCGDAKPGFSTSVFLSERETADRNYALAYFMRENQAFPQGVELEDILEFYLQCCSIEVTTEMMSVVAATLANGGICPVTGERILRTETVRNCLSQMSGCGMYDYSGEFAFTIGLPAKSGVSGAIMVVIPNVMGFCTLSPRLDELGNSVRGIAFSRELVRRFNFHNFDDLTGSSEKIDPRLNPIQIKARQVNEMIWAASKGDVGAIQDRLRRGAAPDCADYDRRAPIHLAAAENQTDVIRFFIAETQRSGSTFDLNPRDRWGGTPLDDAYLHGHGDVIALLEAAGAQRGDARSRATDQNSHTTTTGVMVSSKTDELIWAGSIGDLTAVGRLVAQGVPLDMGDYDHRTILHLAAVEGHLEVVHYCITHGVTINPKDRWGNTPIDDAQRHGHDAVGDLLRRHGAKTGKPASAAAPVGSNICGAGVNPPDAAQRIRAML